MTARPGAKLIALDEAVRRHVRDGDTVFVGGFGQCIPFAIGHELIRQNRRELVLCRSGADILFDLLIAAGCVRKVVFGYLGNPGVGLAHAFRRAAEAGQIEVEDWTMARAWVRAVDLWHLHHPDSVVYLRSGLRAALEALAFCALLSWARWRGVRILWTIHDLGSHDQLHPRLEAWFWRFFVSRVDGFVCLSEGGRKLARERFPALRQRPRRSSAPVQTGRPRRGGSRARGAA